MPEFDLDAMVLGPDGAVSANLRCCKCRYVLKTKRPEDLCPECGTLVQVSIKNRLKLPPWVDYLAAYTLVFLTFAILGGIFFYTAQVTAQGQVWSHGFLGKFNFLGQGILALLIGSVLALPLTLLISLGHFLYLHLGFNPRETTTSTTPKSSDSDSDSQN